MNVRLSIRPLVLAFAGVVAGFTWQVAAAQPSSVSETSPAAAPRRFTPVAYCPQVAKAPKLDGVLDDACWKQAAVLDGFMLDNKDAFATQQTEVRIVHDDKWIYLAARCKEVDMAHQKVFKTGRAMPWDEDSIEMFVDVHRGDSDYEQYCANVLGANNLPLPRGQNDVVVVAGKAGKDEWTLEARLLIESLTKTQPKPGEVWGLNICRNRCRDRGNECSSWARLKGSAHMPDLFGLLIFCDKVPETRVAAIDFYDRFEGDNVAQLMFAGKPGTKVSATLSCPQGDRQEAGQIDAKGSLTLGVPYRLGGGFNAMSLAVQTPARKDPVLKADLREASVTRPDWAKYVPGYGSLVVTVPQDVVAQGEQFTPGVQVVREGPEQAGPQVQWQLKMAGDTPATIPFSAGRFLLDENLPDGRGVLTAEVVVGDKPLTTLQRTVDLAGKALAKGRQHAADLQARLQKIQPNMTSAEMHLSFEKAQAKLNKLGDFLNLRDMAKAGSATEEITYHVSCLEKGQLPVWGHHELVYTSDIDGTEQPFVVTVPKDYDPKGTDKRPVLIWLHCFIGDGWWSREQVTSEYMKPMELAGMKKGFIVVQPYGRGSQGYSADGESDVWDVWKIVNQRWRIDPERVYLAGFSMGGSGTSHLSAAYPERLAAAAAYSGGPDVRQAANYRYLPIRFEAGGQESYGAGMPDWVKAINGVPGRAVESFYVSHPNEGHTSDYVDFEALLDWFSQYRRVADPAVVTFTAIEPRHMSSYWVSIEAPEQYGEPASVDARIEDGALKATTTNVARIAFALPARLLPKDKSLRVVVNGKEVEGVKDGAGRIEVVCATQPAESPGTARQRAVGKTPTLAGPIHNAFAGPLMLVVSGTGEAAAASARSAERISNRWARWHHGKLDAMVEGKADPAELANHNVILVGPWSKQGLIGKVADTAPVAIDEKGIAVETNSSREGKERGIIFIQPNPLNPGRYIVVVTGYSPAGVEAACKLFEQERFRGDYVITPAAAEADAKGLSGFFDAYWR